MRPPGSAAAADRYGHDRELTRATWRALAGVAGAAVLTGAAAVVVASVLLVGKGLFGGLALARETSSRLHVPLVVLLALAAVIVTVVALRRTRPRPGALRPGPRLPAAHPASEALGRLAVLADVPTPPLATAPLAGANAVVLRDDDDVAVICLSPGALLLPRQELDAVLAHELFHVAHGDVGLIERLEHLAQFAEARTIAPVGAQVRRRVHALLHQRELAADRAAALLTGHPSDVVAALRHCGDVDTPPGPLDLRAVTQVAFVPVSTRVPDPHGGGGRAARPPTHPTLVARTESLARVAARLAATSGRRAG